MKSVSEFGNFGFNVLDVCFLVDMSVYCKFKKCEVVDNVYFYIISREVNCYWGFLVGIKGYNFCFIVVYL